MSSAQRQKLGMEALERQGVSLQRMDAVARGAGQQVPAIAQRQNPVTITANLDDDDQVFMMVTTRSGRPTLRQLKYIQDRMPVPVVRGVGGNRLSWEHSEIAGVEQSIEEGGLPFAQTCSLCNCNQCAGAIQEWGIISGTPAQGMGNITR